MCVDCRIKTDQLKECDGNKHRSEGSGEGKAHACCVKKEANRIWREEGEEREREEGKEKEER